MTIRIENPKDYSAILKLTYEAFLTLDYPGRQRMDEHYLIHLLQGSPFVIPELCFVAEQNGEIVGHILYTKNEILRPDPGNTCGSSKTDVITFGPLSILPKFHRQGIGSALVRHSMEKAKELGYGAVLIAGVPDYYPKLGFKRARDYGLTLEDGTSPDAFMAYELRPGYLSGGGKMCFLPPEFEACETDDVGYQLFHHHFMQEHYPNKLILRPFWEADIALLEHWLSERHVAQWYKHPDHWLLEVRQRKGEFSFITHFIAELDGIAIGFCQYYDCFFAQEHEVWNEEWHVGENLGQEYSIDYLIGEPKYLRKGYGKEIVRQLTEKICALGAVRIVVEPENNNIPSNKTLEANGYKYNDKHYVKECRHSESVNSVRIAYCGLLCGLCRPDASCDCRLENHCGKRLSPNGCYQYSCCTEKGLNGCWECSDAPCGKDMHAHEKIKIRAFIRCIKEDGMDKFCQYITRNKEKGIVYHRSGIMGDYDLESEEAVVEFLREGLL